MSDGVQILGMPEVNKALKQFEHKVRKKVLKKAMAKASADIRKQVRAATPKGSTGNLRKSVTSGSRILKNNVIWGGVFFSRKGKKKGFHANWIEYGTAERWVENYRGHDGVSVSVGKISGESMATRMFRKTKGKQVKTFEKYVTEAVQKQQSAN
jgi:hypothetical protein